MAMYVDLVQIKINEQNIHYRNTHILYGSVNLYNNIVLKNFVNMGFLTMIAWIINHYFRSHTSNKINFVSCKYFKNVHKKHGKIHLLASLYSFG